MGAAGTGGNRARRYGVLVGRRLAITLGLIAGVLVIGAACSDGGVSQERHDELRADVKELKSEVKSLQRETGQLAKQAGGAAEGEHAPVSAATESAGHEAATEDADHEAAPSADTGGHAAEESGEGEHGGAVHWTYAGATGPAAWGELSPEFFACSAGANQSPINLVSTTRVSRAEIVFRYRPTALTVINNGHTLQANVEPGSTIEVDGVSYELAQFHFHAPSEHTVGGKHLDLEMHLVHVAASGDLAVIGVLFNRGAASQALAPMWAVLPASTESQGEVAHFDPRDLLPGDGELYRYSGSLTTPPCSEGVKWMVYQTVASISDAQVQAFDGIVGFNNRPVQPLNAREVLAEIDANLAFSAQ